MQRQCSSRPDRPSSKKGFGGLEEAASVERGLSLLVLPPSRGLWYLPCSCQGLLILHLALRSTDK